MQYLATKRVLREDSLEQLYMEWRESALLSVVFLSTVLENRTEKLLEREGSTKEYSTGRNIIASPRNQWTVTIFSLTLCSLNQKFWNDVCPYGSQLEWIKINGKFVPAASFQMWCCQCGLTQINADRYLSFQVISTGILLRNLYSKFNPSFSVEMEYYRVFFPSTSWISAEITELQRKQVHCSDSPLLPLVSRAGDYSQGVPRQLWYTPADVSRNSTVSAGVIVT